MRNQNLTVEVLGLTKEFGSKTAVNRVSFEILPGRVTGFLGPNGSGKTTTMRCMLSLAKPTAGETLFSGVPYNKLKNPLSTVGAMIDAKAFHKARSARAHLQCIARAAGISNSRVDECLKIVGLSDVAKNKAGSFSLGMGQRIGIAAALLGDPKILILDEPVNGLDPEGVKWVRDFCRDFAASGKSVLISSHLMSEVEQTADDLVIIGQGRILRKGTVSEIIKGESGKQVIVASTDMERLNSILQATGVHFYFKKDEESPNPQAGEFIIDGVVPDQIGQLALSQNLILTKLDEVRVNLEQAFMNLTEDAVEYHAKTNSEFKINN